MTGAAPPIPLPTRATVAGALARGWALTPLKPGTKLPLLNGWTKLPRATDAEVYAWLDAGHNLGVRTGPISGIVVVDVDPRNGGDAGPLHLPETLTSATPSGGTHHYLVAPDPCPRNSAGKLGKGVDVRGDGGQVVLYGRWLDPAATLAPFPLELLPAPAERNAQPVVIPAGLVHGGADANKWAQTALQNEIGRISNAPVGTVNDTLCSACFSLGQIVGAGLLDPQEVLELAIGASVRADWDERKSRRTAWAAIQRGTGHPRRPKPGQSYEIAGIEIVGPPTVADAPELTDEDTPASAQSGHTTHTLLIPGAHLTPQGEYIEVSNSIFAEAVLACIPSGTFYRRERVVGQVVAGRFVQVDEDDARRFCDPPNLRLAAFKRAKESSKLVFEPCSTSNARLVLSAARSSAPEIRLLTTYPVVHAGVDGLPTVSAPGYDPRTLTYYHGPAITPEIDPRVIRETFDELVRDFPFEDQASRANFLGLLLTPLLRPLVGKAPFHLTTSPVARAGKSKLIEEVWGIIYLGEPLTSSQLPERTEERAKWLTALLLGGDTLVHLDNLTPELDSGNLASLLTSARVSDRLLGSSTFLRMENNLTVAATGNNTRLSGELAKRTVVIRLVPDSDHPEDRRGFVHQDLPAYVASVRLRVLACLVGAVHHWVSAGQPEASAPFGGFDRWAAVVGGILQSVGVDGHLSNRAAWRAETDEESEAAVGLVTAWMRRWGCNYTISAGTLAIELPTQMAAMGVRLDSPRSAGRRVAALKDRRFAVQAADGSCAHVAVRSAWDASANARVFELELVPELAT